MSPCSTLTASLRCFNLSRSDSSSRVGVPSGRILDERFPSHWTQKDNDYGIFFPAGSSLAVMNDILGYASRKHSQNFKPNSTISPSSINLDLLQCLKHFFCYSSLLNHHLQNSPNQASFNATSTRGPHARQV